jgi:hypothetical protein
VAEIMDADSLAPGRIETGCVPRRVDGPEEISAAGSIRGVGA